MFVTRYRRIALQAPLVGFAVGAVGFGFLALTGNPDWRSYLTLADVLRWVLGYGLAGSAFALVSLLGGAAAVAVADRRLRHAPVVRVSWAGVGAGVAVLLGCTLVGIVQADLGWFGGYLLAGVILGIIAGIAAASMVNRAERHALDEPRPKPRVDADIV
ncbi:hypothetical protein ACLRGF_00250 [Mycetocola zhadangensis]|uniref:hypothetical protein n=1 Tax=Mycetocola zhadangensis TaxID=1164595 RepID=UPI003A4D443C